MQVMGIDPSLTATGLAVVSEQKPSDTWLLTTDSRHPLGKRLDGLSSAISDFVDTCSPDVVVIERPFEIAARPSAVKLGMALGAVLLGISASYPNPALVLLVAPKVRAKYATGKGAARKEAVLSSAIRRLGYAGHDHNEADALWLAYIAAEVAHNQGNFAGPLNGWHTLPVEHYKAIDDWQSWERVL